MELTTSERRGAPREVIDAPLDMLRPHPASGSVLDMSSGGLRAAMNRRIDVGQKCLLRVFSPKSGDVLRWARVVWSEETAGGCVAGMQFG